MLEGCSWLHLGEELYGGQNPCWGQCVPCRQMLRFAGLGLRSVAKLLLWLRSWLWWRHCAKVCGLLAIWEGGNSITAMKCFPMTVVEYLPSVWIRATSLPRGCPIDAQGWSFSRYLVFGKVTRAPIIWIQQLLFSCAYWVWTSQSCIDRVWALPILWTLILLSGYRIWGSSH